MVKMVLMSYSWKGEFLCESERGIKLFGILFYRTHCQGCGVSTAQIIIKLTLRLTVTRKMHIWLNSVFSVITLLCNKRYRKWNVPLKPVDSVCIYWYIPSIMSLLFFHIISFCDLNCLFRLLKFRFELKNIYSLISWVLCFFFPKNAKLTTRKNKYQSG